MGSCDRNDVGYSGLVMAESVIAKQLGMRAILLVSHS